MSSVGNPRRNARKRNAPATRRHALELLAASRDGATEAILVAHGFTVGMLVDMVHAGLAGRAHDRGRPRAVTDVARLVGHRIRGLSFGVYSRPTMVRLAEVVEQIHYEGVKL